MRAARHFPAFTAVRRGGGRGAAPDPVQGTFFKKFPENPQKLLGEKKQVSLCAEGAGRVERRKRTDGRGGMCAENKRRDRTRRGGLRLQGGAGAPPRTPFRELFSKSSLKTLKNFSEGRRELICTQRAQGGLRGEGGRTGEGGMCASNRRRGRKRDSGGCRLAGERESRRLKGGVSGGSAVLAAG